MNMKVLLILLAVAGSATALVAVLVGIAWLTGNVRPMTLEELKAVEDRIKANGSTAAEPSEPQPRPWPARLPRSGPEVKDPWTYAISKILDDPTHWFMQDARYRLDDRDAARKALEEQVKFEGIGHIPPWQGALDILVRDAGGQYDIFTQGQAYCQRLSALLEERYTHPAVLVKGQGEAQAILVDYGVPPGRVYFVRGKFGGWKVDNSEHRDRDHWNTWKSTEVATALLYWEHRYPDAAVFILRISEPSNYTVHHGYYIRRRMPHTFTGFDYWKPDDLGEMGNLFDPKSSATAPRYFTAKEQPVHLECTANDLAAAATGRWNLNEALFHMDMFKERPKAPAISDEERDKIILELVQQADHAAEKKN